MENEATQRENQGYEEDGGKVTWIWNTGLNVGKKILVTGFMISSAPVVLPPLMVISTLGLACAVPYGLFLASYACTEKLMTTLFPRPTTPITYEELGTKDDDENSCGGYVENEELVLKPTVPNTFEELGTKDDDDEKRADVDVENEEEELKQRVGMRIEQDEKRNDSAKVDEKPSEKIDGVVIAIEGEDKNGSNARAEEVPLGVTDVGEIGGVVIAIEGEDKNGSNVREEEMPFEVTDVAVEVYERDTSKGNGELVRETRGLLEKIKDEGMFDEGVGKDKQNAEDKHEGAEEGLKKTDGNMQETVTPLGDSKAHGERTESAEDKHEGTEEGLKETDRHVQETVTPLGDTNAHGGRAQDTVDNHVKKEHKLNTDNVDATEIADESGSNLFVDIKAAQVQYSADNGTSEGSKQSSCVTVESIEITAPSTANAPESGGIASEDLYSEEKIWKQIDAMRMIVGYTASRHETCIEELKALYVYTGVEPPASFKDPSDLVEINAKLRFLMSIIGVK